MSTWSEYKKRKAYPKLDRDTTTDVAVIGGGMAGILTAYRLAAEGKKVVVLEKAEVGSGATIATTAFITEVIDSSLAEIADIFDEGIARSVWRSGRKAVEEFERIIEEEAIECEFMRLSNYVYASTKKEFKELQEEYAWYRRLKLPAELHRDGTKLNFPNLGYLEVPDQAKFYPAKFLYALAEKAARSGVKIFEKTEVLEIEGTGPVTVKTKGGSIKAQDVVITTYKPLSSKKTLLKKAMYRSFVFEVEVPKGLFPEGLYEDMKNPYHYFRIDAGDERDRMIVGGEDHKDIFGNTLVKQSFQGLGEYLEKILGQHRYWIVKKWYGPILEPSDGLPAIGRIAPHRYVATGFSGNGMTYSMITSMLLSDLILGRRNAWAKAYDPSRSILHPKRLGTKAKDYIEEFFGGAVKNLLT